MSDDESLKARRAAAIVDRLGGQAAAAGICRVRRQAVWQWINPGPNGRVVVIGAQHLGMIRRAAQERGMNIDKEIDAYLEALAGRRKRRAKV